jgi:uncharacterized membrane protein
LSNSQTQEEIELMSFALWIFQVLLAVNFFFVGIMHFIIPPGLPAMMNRVYDISPTLHTVSGIAEILGSLGLILPSVTKIQPRLTPLAGAGLVLTIFGELA